MSFTIDLNGGAPWGFGITGGVDRNQPLTVSKVRDGLSSLCRKPESGSERSSMKSRVAAFLETKPQSGFAK